MLRPPNTGTRLCDETLTKVTTAFELTDWLTSFIAKRYGLARWTVYKLRIHFEMFGTPYPPPSVKRGRRSILTLDQERLIFEYVMD
jgi:hypothetical protein